MERLFMSAAGLDVHKELIVCTVLQVTAEGEVKKETKQFSSFRKDLQILAQWLKSLNVQVAVMESTSVYWKSPYEALESVEIPTLVVNARHVKNVPGRKTDVQDSEWLAQLVLCGLLKGSFIPPKDLRELRMLTRYRRKLTGMRASEKNRLQKILDDSGIRLSCVVSDIDGVSARKMIQIIIEKGFITLDEVKKAVKGQLKRKTQELALSLDGRISDRHRFVLKQMQKHIQNLDEQLQEIDDQIVAAMKPYHQEWQILQTIPGIDVIGAAMLLAEIGVDMSKFGNKDRLCSWAGISPGNNESAGKKKAVGSVKQTSI
jgi:transposase